MSEKPKHHKKERKDFAFGISRSEFFTSVAVGVGSGLATAAKTVRDLFKDDSREATAFDGHFNGNTHRELRQGETRTLGRQERLDAIDAQKMLAAGKTKDDFQRSISNQKRIFQTEFDEIAHVRRLISKNPVVGIIDKFKLLSPDSKKELYFTGAIGAVIGTAVTLGFFNGVATRDKIERIEDAVGADPSQQNQR